MRILFLFPIVLLIVGMTCCLGCSRDSGIIDVPIISPIEDDEIPDGWDIVDIWGGNVEISISESRPAEVIVTVYASSFDTCISIHQVHQERIGDTIFIRATILLPSGSAIFACGAAVTEVEEQVSIGMFTAGEYKVNVNGIEHIFRVE